MVIRLLDTNIVSYRINRHTLSGVYQRHTAGYDLAVSFMTVGELLEGAGRAGFGASRRADMENELSQLLTFDSTRPICDWFAEVRVARRRQPIGVADAWIAATALAYGLELVTHNPADFAGIPGLTIITECP